MPRDYAKEYRARELRARSAGSTYSLQRRERERERVTGLHPSRFAGDNVAPAGVGFGADLGGLVEEIDPRDEPHGLQAPYSPVQPDPDWESIITKTTAGQGREKRPFTLQARYSRIRRVVQVEFRSGVWWTWFSVPPLVWQQFLRADSRGRFVDAVLSTYANQRDGGKSIGPLDTLLPS